jgi:mycofactocin precursor
MGSTGASRSYTGECGSIEVERMDGKIMEDSKKRESAEAQTTMEEDAVFAAEEIEIEEMAIDGICGVY